MPRNNQKNDHSADIDGKPTISPTTHGNIGQRQNVEEHEIHPDDHADEGEPTKKNGSQRA